MKKVFSFIGILVSILLMSGCVIESNNNKIYTTSYPITFITSYLLGDSDKIESIYPNDTNPDEFKWTNKITKEYAKGKIFIYNGLTGEKEYAKKLVNTNPKLNIIDASENIKYDYSVKESWFCPYNFMVLVKNIKEHLIELSTSQEDIKTINNNYKVLEQEISSMDAYLRNVAAEYTKSEKKPVIISANSDFKYLEDYGFEVISLEDSISDTNLATIKANFKNKNYESIIAFNGYENSEIVNSLVSECDAKIVYVNPIVSLTNDDVLKNETYITLMNSFIESLKNVVAK